MVSVDFFYGGHYSRAQKRKKGEKEKEKKIGWAKVCLPRRRVGLCGWGGRGREQRTAHVSLTCTSDVCVSLSVSVALSVCHSLCLFLSVILFVSVTLSVSVCHCLCHCLCLCHSLSVFLSVSLSLSLSVSVSLCLCLSVCLSLFLVFGLVMPTYMCERVRPGVTLRVTLEIQELTNCPKKGVTFPVCGRRVSRRQTYNYAAGRTAISPAPRTAAHFAVLHAPRPHLLAGVGGTKVA